MAPRGAADPRWVQLARAFAGAGLDVVHPHFPCVAGLRIEPAQVDRFGAAIDAVAEHPRWADAGPPALSSVSFSGGLALAAAGRRAGGAPLGPALLIGAFADLEGALRGLVERPSPDPYALHLMIANFAEAALGPLPGLPEAMRAAAADNAAGLGDTAAVRLRGLAPEVRARGVALLTEVEARSALVEGLRRRRPDLIEALDPLRLLRPVAGPVVLLHGAADAVVAPEQSRALAARLAALSCEVRLCVSPLISHGDTRPAALAGLPPLLRAFGVFLEAARGPRPG
jgi:pimeloyl-ACP methyl ester carboxylesterase